MKKLILQIQNNKLRESPDWTTKVSSSTKLYLKHHALEVNKGILQQRGVRSVINKYELTLSGEIPPKKKQLLNQIWTLTTSKMEVMEIYLNYILIIDYVLRVYAEYNQEVIPKESIWEAEFADKHTN